MQCRKSKHCFITDKNWYLQIQPRGSRSQTTDGQGQGRWFVTTSQQSFNSRYFADWIISTNTTINDPAANHQSQQSKTVIMELLTSSFKAHQLPHSFIHSFIHPFRKIRLRLQANIWNTTWVSMVIHQWPLLNMSERYTAQNKWPTKLNINYTNNVLT